MNKINVILGSAHFLLGYQSAIGTWSFGARILTLVAVIVAILLIAHLGKKLTAPNPNGPERKEALRLGITVSDVERDLPVFSRGNQACKLERGPCVRYSLPRHGEGTRSVWSLLQRTERDGAQLPNDYLLQGGVSDSLRQALTRVATEFSEEYFELEGTATDVAVCWEEWGGASQVQEIHKVLQNLAGL